MINVFECTSVERRATLQIQISLEMGRKIFDACRLMYTLFTEFIRLLDESNSCFGCMMCDDMEQLPKLETTSSDKAKCNVTNQGENMLVDSHKTTTKIPVFDTVAISNPPYTDPIASEVRRIISVKLQNVYEELCSIQSFSTRNILLPDSTEFTFNPAIDSMCVVFSANELMRHKLDGDTAALVYESSSFLSLNIRCRLDMAASLFLSYKLASEDSWSCKNGSMSIAKYILGKFILPYEVTSKEASQFPELLVRAELDLLNYFKIHTIIEFNAMKVVEYKLEHLLANELLTPLASAMALSVASFYANYLFRTVTSTEFLETSADQYGANTVTTSIVCVSIASVFNSFTTDVSNLPRIHRISFCEASLELAAEMLKIRINAKPTKLGFPSMCSKPVADKALVMVNEALHMWRQVESRENVETNCVICEPMQVQNHVQAKAVSVS